MVHLDYNVSSGPFLSLEIEIGDGPGPELDNNELSAATVLNYIGFSLLVEPNQFSNLVYAYLRIIRFHLLDISENG